MITYRRDIDGLRAIAVTSVVLFHAELAPLRGGFIGVDIFFVISGYLITTIIAGEIQSDKFSLMRFYDRRIRRIFPALFCVLLFTTITAYLLEMPGPFDDFCKSLVATASFVSNIIFWRQTGYFDAPALEKPLLHTWSLAVEEQFYIFFPLTLMLIYKKCNGKLLFVLGIFTLLSFIACVCATYFSPTSAFFLAPMRAWELLIGSILAIANFPLISQKNVLEAISVIGLALIVYAAAFFNEGTLFPGAAAAIPTAGAALLIYSGAEGGTRISRFLALKPFVAIGLISYSLYLWHWPLLVFAQIFEVGEVSSAERVVVVAVSLLLAALSWKYVEAPFRAPSKIPRGPMIGGAAVAMSAFIGFGLFGHWSGGWPGRLPTRVQEIAAYAYTGAGNPRQNECLASPELSISAEAACVYGGSAKPSYALWGDSHASTLIGMLGVEAAKSNNAIKFFGYRGCPPLEEAGRIREYTSCLPHNDEVMAYLIAHKEIHTVVLSARWSFYIFGYAPELGPAERQWVGGEFITDRDRSNFNVAERQEFFVKRINATVDRLIAAKKTVVLVYPIPETGFDIPLTLGELALSGKDPSKFTHSIESFYKRNKFVFSALDSVASSENLIRIYPNERLCNKDDDKCIVYADGKLLYQDDDHLSFAGANYISPLFLGIFNRKQALSNELSTGAEIK
jgi:peptidoglycan/LPS O-acetylase OafA/YrhL